MRVCHARLIPAQYIQYAVHILSVDTLPRSLELSAKNNTIALNIGLEKFGMRSTTTATETQAHSYLISASLPHPPQRSAASSPLQP